jgi:DNA polymerase III sliding clamp (beta) subunit (PCNA family)
MDGNKKEFIELSEEELFKLPEKEFFEYLDRKAEHLKQFTVPLGEYHTKQFLSQTVGDKLTTKQLKRAKENIRKAVEKLDLKPVDLGVKVKKRGGGWVD